MGRQKWFSCFDKVMAILFLASSSEFDQKLMEDTRVNRLEESRNIFDTIVNHRTFAATSMILFLNKQDLLEDKVTRKKLTFQSILKNFKIPKKLKNTCQTNLVGILWILQM